MTTHLLSRRISAFSPCWFLAARYSCVNLRIRKQNSVGNLGSSLKFHKSAISKMTSEARELRIPLPYGFIAAKAWGSDKGSPVLALHGWQDNAGTFDNLVPLLSPSLYTVAVDSVGHGLSSHKPDGTFYHFMELTVDIERVVRYLKWEKFSIIGHSLGGTLALMYGSLFPDRVSNIVLLDVIKPASRIPDALPSITADALDELLQLESKIGTPAPVYTPQEAKTRLIQGMYGEVTPRSVEILMKRGTKPSPCGKGLNFSRDIKVKATESLQKLSHDALKAYLCKLRCNMLIVLTKNSVIARSRTPEVIEEFLDIYRNVCPTFQMVEIEGSHFVHLNDAGLVAPHVNAFFDAFLKDLSKL